MVARTPSSAHLGGRDALHKFVYVTIKERTDGAACPASLKIVQATKSLDNYCYLD